MPLYEIRIRGRLTPAITEAFADLTVDAVSVETVFTGRLEDQAALRGILEELSAAGIEVVDVHRLPIGAAGEETADAAT